MTNKSKGKSEKQKMSLSLAMIITCLPLGKIIQGENYFGIKPTEYLSLPLILGTISGSAERRLLEDLMNYYQKLERPVANESEAVQLKFGLTLQQIMDVVGIRVKLFLDLNIFVG